jgi:HEAT repeat protein
MSKLQIVTGCGAVILLGVGAAALSSRTRHPLDDEATAVAQRTMPSPAATPAEAGRRRRYALSFDMAVKSGETQPFHMKLDAQLTSTIVRGQGAAYTAGFDLAEPRLQATPASAAAMPGLSQRFYADYQDGRITRVYVRPGMNSATRAFLANLLAYTQFVRGGDVASWTAHEPDGTGETTVRYACRGRICEKRKIGYDRVSVPGTSGRPVATLPSVRASVVKVTLDASGWLAGIEGREAYALDSPVLAMSGETSLHLELLASEAGPPGDGMPPGLLAATLPELCAVGDASAAHRATPAELSAAIDKLVALARAEDHDAVKQSLGQLTGLLRSNPALVAQAFAYVKGGGADASDVLSALARSGIPGVEAGLVDLVRQSELSSDLRGQAIRALALRDDVNADTVSALRELLDHGEGDLHRQGTYAYASAASSLTTSAPARAQEILNTLGARYEQASSPAERELVIRAFGNTGNPEALRWLKPAAASSDVETRADAVKSLRLIDDDGARQLIAEALLRDPEAEVRSAALVAIDYQPPAASLPLLRQFLEREEEERLRAAAVRQIGEHLDRAPQGHELLAFVAERDRSSDVRQLATSLLAGHGLPSPN